MACSTTWSSTSAPSRSAPISPSSEAGAGGWRCWPRQDDQLAQSKLVGEPLAAPDQGLGKWWPKQYPFMKKPSAELRTLLRHLAEDANRRKEFLARPRLARYVNTTCPRVSGCGRETEISTSQPSSFRNRIRRSVEKPSSRPLVMAETLGWSRPRMSAACACVRRRALMTRLIWIARTDLASRVSASRRPRSAKGRRQGPHVDRVDHESGAGGRAGAGA